MTYMLDTNICIYAIKNKPEYVLRKIKDNMQEGLCISAITLAELVHGVEKSMYPEKNRDARIVINAISLETVKEVMEAAESGLLRHPQITQISVARSRELGRYHMMTGQNPVYIISAGGAEDERGEA